jgi:hypothetical protein
VFNDIKLLNSSSLNSINPEASEYAKYLLWFLKIEKKGDMVRVGCMVFTYFFPANQQPIQQPIQLKTTLLSLLISTAFL